MSRPCAAATDCAGPYHGPMSAAIPSLREAQKALTRSRIVDAARAVFEREGYGGTSIGHIANAAAINRATFYLHFPGKADVFRAVFADDRMHTDEHWHELNTALLTGTRTSVSPGGGRPSRSRTRPATPRRRARPSIRGRYGGHR